MIPLPRILYDFYEPILGRETTRLFFHRLPVGLSIW